MGVSLFITRLIPSCLRSHLRGHLGNQTKRQAQGRASEAPQLRSSSSDLREGPGSLQAKGQATGPLTPLSSPSSSAQGTQCYWDSMPSRLKETGDERGLTETPPPHTNPQHTPRAPEWRAPHRPAHPQARPSTGPSTHGAVGGGPSARSLAGPLGDTALQALGWGARHLEALLSVFGALTPSDHGPRAQPAWGAREQGDVCKRQGHRGTAASGDGKAWMQDPEQLRR